MANRPKSIKQALELGIVIHSGRRKAFNFKYVYAFYVKYYIPIALEDGSSLKGEWFECSERYFKTFVRKHRNFKA